MFFRLVRILSKSFMLMESCCYKVEAVLFTRTSNFSSVLVSTISIIWFAGRPYCLKFVLESLWIVIKF